MMLLLLTLFVFQTDAPFVLVLKNKQSIELQKEPEYKNNLAYLLHVNGQKMTLPAKMVDIEATERYNEALTEHRQKAQREAERIAAEAAAAKNETPEPPPVIEINNSRQVPEYDHSRNAVTGFKESNEDTPADQKTFEFSSEDPVYVAKETQTTTADSVIIDGILKINYEGRVQNVKVTLKVSLAQSGEQELRQAPSPTSGTQGDQLSVRFTIPTTEKVLRTSFQVEAELVE